MTFNLAAHAWMFVPAVLVVCGLWLLFRNNEKWSDLLHGALPVVCLACAAFFLLGRWLA